MLKYEQKKSNFVKAFDVHVSNRIWLSKIELLIEDWKIFHGNNWRFYMEYSVDIEIDYYTFNDNFYII